MKGLYIFLYSAVIIAIIILIVLLIMRLLTTKDKVNSITTQVNNVLESKNELNNKSSLVKDISENSLLFEVLSTMVIYKDVKKLLKKRKKSSVKKKIKKTVEKKPKLIKAVKIGSEVAQKAFNK